MYIPASLYCAPLLQKDKKCCKTLLLPWTEVFPQFSRTDSCVCVFSRLLSEILKETNEDIEEIEYLTDGSWRPIKDDKEKDRERERSNTPEYPVVDICTSHFDLFPLMAQIS